MCKRAIKLNGKKWEKNIDTMKVIWSSIKRHKYIIGILLISIIVLSGYTFFVKLEPSDALCNFSNIYKMYNGGKIYNDCNVIITPIFFYVGLFIFKILGANFITFGIYNILIFIFLEVLIYKLFYTLNSNEKKSFIEALLIFMYLVILVPAGANYNILVFSFVILGIIISIKYENSKFIELLQGIVCFTIFFTKQNIGAFYILALLVYNLYRGINNKNIKKYIMISIKELLVFALLLIIALIYMFFNGNIQQFINYCVLGIGEFANLNLTGSIISILTTVFTLAFIILIEIISVKALKIEKAENLTVLTIFSIAMLGYTYPLLNTYHIILGNTLIFIIIIYWLDLMLEKIKINKKIKISIKITISILVMIVIIRGVYNFYWAGKISYKGDSIYKGIYISEETNDNINKICEYIQNKKQSNIDVKIISYKAPIYMTLLKINNGEFDWPLNGNFGRRGQDGLIDKISELTNTEILITKDEEDKNYQESEKIRDYIINNLEKIGEIEEFYIYKTPVYENNNYTNN